MTHGRMRHTRRAIRVLEAILSQHEGRQQALNCDVVALFVASCWILSFFCINRKPLKCARHGERRNLTYGFSQYDTR